PRARTHQGDLHDQAARGARPLRARVHTVRERDHAAGEGRGREGARMIRTLALAAALLGWATVTYGNRALEVMNPALLPTPGEVAAVTVALARDGSLARDVLASSGRIVAGFGLAAVAALALGLAVALYAPARLAVEPLVEFLRPIPPLAFLPM